MHGSNIGENSEEFTALFATVVKSRLRENDMDKPKRKIKESDAVGLLAFHAIGLPIWGFFTAITFVGYMFVHASDLGFTHAIGQYVSTFHVFGVLALFASTALIALIPGIPISAHLIIILIVGIVSFSAPARVANNLSLKAQLRAEAEASAQASEIAALPESKWLGGSHARAIGHCINSTNYSSQRGNALDSYQQWITDAGIGESSHQDLVDAANLGDDSYLKAQDDASRLLASTQLDISNQLSTCVSRSDRALKCKPLADADLLCTTTDALKTEYTASDVESILLDHDNGKQTTPIP